MNSFLINKLFIFFLLLTPISMYSQNFYRFENVEELFNLNKSEIENLIKTEYNYKYRSKDVKSGIITYVREVRPYTFTVNLIFSNNKLKAIGWDDIELSGYYIVKEIGEDSSYKIDESKTNDNLGIITAISKEKDLQISTFNTLPNKQKGMIAFSLSKIGNKKITIKKKIREEEIVKVEETPKLYNLEEKDIESYNKLVELQKNKIFDYLKNGNEKELNTDLGIPVYENMVKNKTNIFSFDNIYNIYYKTEDNSRPTITTNKVVYAGNINIRQIFKVENLEGSDKISNLLNKNKISIPTFKENEREIMTELSIKNVQVIYQKGYVFGKIKKKNLILDSPNFDKRIENEIKSKLEQQKNGNYLIGYIYINVMGKEELIINFEELKKQNSSLNRFFLKSSYSIMRSLL